MAEIDAANIEKPKFKVDHLYINLMDMILQIQLDSSELVKFTLYNLASMLAEIEK